jgi:hypothetical protein
MVAIRCDEEQRQLAASLFLCQHVEFPITYRGVPLSTIKLPRSISQWLIDRVADKLPVWKGALMLGQVDWL